MRPRARPAPRPSPPARRRSGPGTCGSRPRTATARWSTSSARPAARPAPAGCTCTSASRPARRASASSTGCARGCRWCSPSASTRPTPRAATAGTRPGGPRSGAAGPRPARPSSSVTPRRTTPWSRTSWPRARRATRGWSTSRPASPPTWPTVEVRVADVCTDPDDAVVVAGVVRAIAVTAAAEWEAGTAPRPWRSELLRAAAWRAGRYGLAGTLVHPVDARARPCAAGAGVLRRADAPGARGCRRPRGRHHRLRAAARRHGREPAAGGLRAGWQHRGRGRRPGRPHRGGRGSWRRGAPRGMSPRPTVGGRADARRPVLARACTSRPEPAPYLLDLGAGLLGGAGAAEVLHLVVGRVLALGHRVGRDAGC